MAGTRLPVEGSAEVLAQDFEPLLDVFDWEVVRWQGYPSDPVALREIAYQRGLTPRGSHDRNGAGTTTG